MAVSADVLSQTILAIEPEVSMALTRATPFLDQVKSQGKVHKFSGSYALRIPVEVQEPSNTTVLTTGYEAIDLTARDATAYGQFSWGRFVRPVSISGRELAENAGEYQVVDLAETKYKSSLSGLMRQMNKQITVGGTAFSELGTLNGITSASTGFLQNLDIGSQDNVVGGLSKVTYASVPGWQNQWSGAIGALSSNVALTALRTVRTGAALNVPSSGDGKLFHVILAHRSFFDAYESDLFAVTRYIDQKTLDGGAFGLAFGDAIVCPDPDITAASGTLSTGDILGYALNLDGVTLAIHDQGDFKFSNFIATPEQDVTTGHIIFMGGLIARNLGAQGIITY